MATVYLATPCYGGMVTAGYALSLLRAVKHCEQAGVGLEIATSSGDSLVTRARNNMLALFMASKATHLLFVDADITFPAEAIVSLVESNYPVCGVTYPKKTQQGEPPGYVINFLETTRGRIKLEQDWFIRCEYLGTGFLMIKREVIEQMQAAHPELKCHIEVMPKGVSADHMYALFDTMIAADGRHLSEDWAFCERWKQLGGAVHCCLKHNLNHTGTHTWRGDMAAWMSGKASHPI